MRINNNKKLYVLVSVLFSFGVILYVLSRLDWSLVRLTISDLQWAWLTLAFLSYVVNYYFRTRRFQMLLSLEKVSFLPLLSVVGLYGMYNYLLPAKSGELTLVVLLKNRLKISLVNGTTSLIVARYLDFVTISLILPVVLFIYFNRLPLWMIKISLSFCVLFFFLSIFLYFVIRSPAGSQLLSRSHTSWIDRVIKALIEMRNSVVVVYQKRLHYRLLLNTFVIWLSVYTNLYLVMVSLGYQMTYFQIIVISVFMIPMTLLPIQGLANLGTHEIGWVAAFSVFGLPATEALGIAVSSHIILLFFVLLLGFISFLLGALTQSMNLS